MISIKGIIYLIAGIIFVGLITLYIGIKYPGESQNTDFQAYSKKDILMELSK